MTPPTQVRQDRLADVAAIVKREMELAMPLRVPTPVKLSVGTTWGNLEVHSLESLQSMSCSAVKLLSHCSVQSL